MPPETRYAASGDAQIAYQVVGDGPLDLLFVPSFLSNIELGWDHPAIAAFSMRLARFARLILFDRRGNGMSDGLAGASPLEEQVDDVRAVLEAADAPEAAVLAINEGARLALLFAASHPESVRALVLAAPVPRLVRGPGYEWAKTQEQREASIGQLVATWGRDEPGNAWAAMGGDDPELRAAMTRYQRLASGPNGAAATLLRAGETDVREVLGSIQCPTLVLRRSGDEEIDVRHSRTVAEGIPGARYLEIGGSGQVWVGDPEEPGREIEAFLTGSPPRPASERVLATVMFTDIVGSTALASEMGDGRWRELLGRHDSIVREEVGRHRGRVVKSLGDGALALFDGPSRAVGCAVSLRDRLAAIDLPIRAGLHTGECELLGDGDVGGMAVHIGARIAALAAPEEVLASRTVRDLSIGSPFTLDDRGEHELKGVAEPWRVYAAGG
ncbi:MAG TPA: adenylate/guanylate cyclase domain-containing protein [Solirubrobacteraceae bacterium]|nr:adenylate/guanylate cyclase domain-containing protein [Solirubrobacteraceae bacterium]